MHGNEGVKQPNSDLPIALADASNSFNDSSASFFPISVLLRTTSEIFAQDTQVLLCSCSARALRSARSFPSRASSVELSPAVTFPNALKAPVSLGGVHIVCVAEC